MSSSSCLAAIKSANGNQALMWSKFEEWVEASLRPPRGIRRPEGAPPSGPRGRRFHWSAGECKAIFGQFTNASVLSDCVEIMTEALAKQGGRPTPRVCFLDARL